MKTHSLIVVNYLIGKEARVNAFYKLFSLMFDNYVIQQCLLLQSKDEFQQLVIVWTKSSFEKERIKNSRNTREFDGITNHTKLVLMEGTCSISLYCYFIQDLNIQTNSICVHCPIMFK